MCVAVDSRCVSQLTAHMCQTNMHSYMSSMVNPANFKISHIGSILRGGSRGGGGAQGACAPPKLLRLKKLVGEKIED